MRAHYLITLAALLYAASASGQGIPIPPVNPKGGGGASTTQGIGGGSPNKCGKDGVCNAVNFGADPKGILDSGPAFNSTVAAACTNQDAVYLPAGTYLVATVPWLDMCTPLVNSPDIRGAGTNSTFIKGYVGRGVGSPSVQIFAAPFDLLSTVGGSAQLIIPGLLSGNAFNWTTGAGHYLNGGFTINEAIGNQYLNGMSAFDVRAVIELTANNAVQYLSSSDGAATPITESCSTSDGPNGTPTCHGAYLLAVGSDGKLYAALNTSVTGWTGPSTLKSSGALSTGTIYQVELSYDGSNIRLFHGATGGGAMTLDAKSAATGTIVQRGDEDMTLGYDSQDWHNINPIRWFLGSVDTFEIANAARCSADACNSTSAKFPGDSHSAFLENWTNVSNLPLVGPEYTRGAASNASYGSGGGNQPYMAMANFGMGNPDTRAFVSDLSIAAAGTAFRAAAASANLNNITITTADYGIILDEVNDYNSLIVNAKVITNVLGVEAAGGGTPIFGSQVEGGLTAIETDGPLISNVFLQIAAVAKWDVLLIGDTQIDAGNWDVENGGSSAGVAINQAGMSMNNSKVFVPGTVAPIVVDGQYDSVSVRSSALFHQAGHTGPFVDVSKGSVAASSGAVTFDNDLFEAKQQPSDTAGDSYVSLTDRVGTTVPYRVLSGGPDIQKTLTGTSAGTVVWGEPIQTTTRKQFLANLVGYENTTGTAQTITYPVAFATVANVVTEGGSCSGVTTSTTVLTLPSSMGATQSGQCTVVGY